VPKKSLNDALVAASPAPSATPPGAVVHTVVDDLDRILALPRRPPLDCMIDEHSGRYSPRAQALIDLMTSRLGRGPRVSCGCRPRVIAGLPGGRISITRVLPEEAPPEPPTVVPIAAFVADNVANADEIAIAQRVSRLGVGDVIRLDAADPSDGGEGHVCINVLNAIQAWALWEIPREAGGMGFCGVGSGKSVIFLLLPIALGAECELGVLLIEPNQRQHYVSQYLRVREHFRVPSVIHEDSTKTKIVPGAPTLHLFPYSKLGNPKHPDDLDVLNPNFIGADEAHRLTGPTNSTGRTRVRRYVEKKIKERVARIAEGLPVHRRAVYLVPMSGTLEDKSIKDTQPVAAHALGMGSPLPLDAIEAEKWSNVFDPVRVPDRKSRTAKRLQKAFAGWVWGEGDDVASALFEGPEKELREGYRQRRMETPGVISANAESVGASLYFHRRKAPKIPDVVAAALKKVREEGIRPDGEVIVGDDDNNAEAMVKIVAKQVALGCYYYWAFPKVPCTCKGQPPRCEGCQLIDEWYQRRKKYGKELRSRLLQSMTHLDSPKLCKNAAIRAEEDTSAPTGVEVYCVTCRNPWPCGKVTHLPAWRSTHWKLWNEIEDKVPHDQRVKWIGHDLPEAADPATHPGYYLARDTAAWAQENLGVVWYQTVAFGQKVAQLAKLPCHGGGPDSEAVIRAETGKRSIIASLKSHGKGLDGLQLKFFKQLFPEIPSSNRVMEQVLGRLVRRGQKSDEVLSWYYDHVLEFRESMRRVKARAEFNQSMQNPALILSAIFEDD
jgi:hypothetical protein